MYSFFYSDSYQNSSNNIKLLDGLLSPHFNEESCKSRYQSFLYKKPSPHKPSSYLISQLRTYEKLHQKCGPHSQSFKISLQNLKNGINGTTTDCKYIIWMAFSGLGNRILTITSAFLYAILTNRILLIDQGTDMGNLFCDPFPFSSWVFSFQNFPINQTDFNPNSPYGYGNLLQNGNFSNGWVPSFSYINLVHDYKYHDKLFFCDEHKKFLDNVTWLVMKSDLYFIPPFFLMLSFEGELNKLFPNKDTIFHHLGRYLFHPSNQVWGLITRYYQAYLSNSFQKIGIQIRVFESGSDPFQYVIDQILKCTQTQKILPQVNFTQPKIPIPSKNPKVKSVLVTSLISGYYEKLKNMYWSYQTTNGDIIAVHQPSHDEYQQTGDNWHDMKAYAEMYLLSLSDVLVTSSWSTFGYVAQGFGGVKPWILTRPENRTAPDPPCRPAMSLEPCFHAPVNYQCKGKREFESDNGVPYVKHCDDMQWGIKLVDV